MERLSDNAIEIVNELHTERLDYESEYVPIIDALNRLAEYEDAEEQGLLVRLPCKVGDTVYDISEFVERIPYPEMYEFHTDYIGIRKSDDGKTVISLDFMDYYMDDFGRIVFTSREEAEKALEDCND